MACRARSTFSGISAADLVQTRRPRTMVVCLKDSLSGIVQGGRTEVNTPRRIRFCVRVEKKRSTRLSHEVLVGVKCRKIRPWRSIPAGPSSREAPAASGPAPGSGSSRRS